jgi:hypothetical protein
MKSIEDHSTNKGNYKTGLTLTGLLMEGLGPSESLRSSLVTVLPIPDWVSLSRALIYRLTK